MSIRAAGLTGIPGWNIHSGVAARRSRDVSRAGAGRRKRGGGGAGNGPVYFASNDHRGIWPERSAMANPLRSTRVCRSTRRRFDSVGRRAQWRGSTGPAWTMTRDSVLRIVELSFHCTQLRSQATRASQSWERRGSLTSRQGSTVARAMLFLADVDCEVRLTTFGRLAFRSIPRY